MLMEREKFLQFHPVSPFFFITAGTVFPFFLPIRAQTPN
jgi:hypothetical protein